MEGKKQKTDWESIERDYRAGVLSIREIAKLHEITEGAIRKKAKLCDWMRDLSEKVNAKVRTELVRASVRTATPEEQMRTEREIVDAAAATVVHVIRDHRMNIKRLHVIALALMDELGEQTIDRALYVELGDLLRSEDDKAQDKRNDLYQKIISGAGRIDGVKKLAETLKILIGLERQAFNMSVEPEEANDGTMADRMKAARERAKQKP